MYAIFLSGYEVTTVENAVKVARLFVTATGCNGILRGEHFVEMLDESIVCNIGQFDSEIDVSWLKENCQSKDTIKPQVKININLHVSLFIYVVLSTNVRWPPSRCFDYDACPLTQLIYLLI